MDVVRSTVTCTAVCVLTSMLSSAAFADTLLGEWVLSRERQPAVKRRMQFDDTPWCEINPFCYPQPVSNNRQPHPKVLQCRAMTIELVSDEIHFNFVGIGKEQLKLGKVHGTKTTFRPRKLTSRYQTTRRKVKKTYALTKEGRLHVTVKINPNEGKTVIHQRIFDRAN